MTAMSMSFENERLWPSVTASCPGKVLVAGGYLITDPAYSGLAYAVGARMRAHAKLRIKKADEQNFTLEDAETCLLACVRSPQFSSEQDLYYIVRITPYAFEVIHAKKELTGVDFRATLMQKALEHAISLAPQERDTLFTSSLRKRRLPLCLGTQCDKYGMVLEVCVTADPEFYANPTAASLKEAGKTGLGSSATVVTAVVAAVANFISPKKEENIEKDLIFHAARNAHMEAQAKFAGSAKSKGSGFDVAVAVYGSLRYTKNEVPNEASVLRMPPFVKLSLIQVSKTGSDTRLFLEKVLYWRTRNPKDSDKLWASMRDCIDNLKDVKGDIDIFRTQFKNLRHFVAEMGQASGADIEPESMRILLNEIENIPGLIGVGVPGAGGWDAFFVFSLESFGSTVVDLVIEKAKAHFGDVARVIGSSASSCSSGGLCVSWHSNNENE